MASPKGGGLGLLIALAISILSALSFAGALFFQQSAIDAEKKKVNENEQRVTELQKEVVARAQQFDALARKFHGTSAMPDLAMIDQNLLKAASERVAEVLNQEKWFDEEAAKKLQLKD